MKKNKKILVVGRAGLDLYAHPINTPIENASQFTSQLGGSAANIAAGLAIQGNNVDLMSPISNDSIGDFVINSCKKIGINTLLLEKVSNLKNTLAIVDTMGDRTNAVLYREKPADLFIDETFLKKVNLDSYLMIIVTGTSLSRNPSRNNVLKLMELAIKRKIEIVLDIDYREGSWNDKKKAEKTLYSASLLSNIVVGNDLEFNIADNSIEGFQLAKSFINEKPSIIIYKMGEKGSTVITKEKEQNFGIFKVEAIKPTGAGDAFNGGFISSIIQGYSLEDSIKRGSANAAIVVTKVGCSSAMPNTDELENFINQQTMEI